MSKRQKIITPYALIDENWFNSLDPYVQSIYIANRIVVEADVDEYQTYANVYDFFDSLLKERGKSIDTIY